jgi:hypothetical protein
MRQILLSTFLVLVISMATLFMGVVSSIPLATQSNSTATVYFDPPTINGTVIGENFTVNLMIRDAQDVYAWQAGLIFNSTFLNCTGFYEGEFLKDVGGAGYTFWVEGSINNTVGNGTVIAYGCTLLRDVKASGNGRLAYLNFTVKIPGISDLHLRDVLLGDWIEVTPGQWKSVIIPSNIIDVYTIIVNATLQTVVAVSNSTGAELLYHSGFYNHAFNSSLEEISFYVVSPYFAFCNITIPKTLLWPEPPYVWGVLMNGSSVSKTVTSNETHSSIYFTYDTGIYDVKITTRFLPSNITLSLSSTSISKGDSVTLSGGIGPVRSGVNVTILYRLSNETKWTTLANVTTDTESNYSYDWTPNKAGTYKVKAKWLGDETTLGAESEEQTLTVKAASVGIPIEIIAVAVVVIIAIVAIAVYFVKFRKPEEE